MQAQQGGRKRPQLGGWDEGNATAYMTLAKAGGRKDLLCHMEYVRTSAVPQQYSKVDWFDHPTPPSHSPLQSPGAQDHAGNTLLQWNMPMEEESPRMRLPKIHKKEPQMKRLQRPHEQKRVVKLPPVPTEPVDFSRLLSMDYQKLWLEDNRRKWEDQRRRNKAKREARKQKLAEHTLRARQISGVDVPADTKPRFIMKRFANIPSKLDLPRLQ